MNLSSCWRISGPRAASVHSRWNEAAKIQKWALIVRSFGSVMSALHNSIKAKAHGGVLAFAAV